jgi:hypothetical protein
MGDVYGGELDATIEELEDWRERLTTYFEMGDPQPGDLGEYDTKSYPNSTAGEDFTYKNEK